MDRLKQKHRTPVGLALARRPGLTEVSQSTCQLVAGGRARSERGDCDLESNGTRPVLLLSVIDNVHFEYEKTDIITNSLESLRLIDQYI